jgi:hypothetical protein
VCVERTHVQDHSAGYPFNDSICVKSEDSGGNENGVFEVSNIRNRDESSCDSHHCSDDSHYNDAVHVKAEDSESSENCDFTFDGNVMHDDESVGDKRMLRNDSHDTVDQDHTNYHDEVSYDFATSDPECCSAEQTESRNVHYDVNIKEEPLDYSFSSCSSNHQPGLDNCKSDGDVKMGEIPVYKRVQSLETGFSTEEKEVDLHYNCNVKTCTSLRIPVVCQDIADTESDNEMHHMEPIDPMTTRSLDNNHCNIGDRLESFKSQDTKNVSPCLSKPAWICTVCGETFHRKGILNKHMLIHTGKTTFSCTICGKRFTQSVHLKHHIYTHTGDKPYACTECGECFTQSTHLKQHKSSTQACLGKKHMASHTGLKP